VILFVVLAVKEASRRKLSRVGVIVAGVGAAFVAAIVVGAVLAATS
jgi:hypothetical protein